MKLHVTFDKLRPGDVLLEADGCNVRQPNPCTVERAADGRKYLELVKPRLITTEFNLYRAFADIYLIERAPVGNLRAADDDGTLSRLALAVPRIEYATRGPGWAAIPPGGRAHGRAPECGDVVLVTSGKFWRAAVVTDVGRKNVRVAFTTPHGVREALRSYLRVMRPYAPIRSVYVVTGEQWAQEAIGAVDA